MSCSEPIPFGFYVILQTELITRNRTLYGGTASSWDLVPRCRA